MSTYADRASTLRAMRRRRRQNYATLALGVVLVVGGFVLQMWGR